MIKLACGVRGCWPILASTTTSTTTMTTTAALITTTETDISLNTVREKYEYQWNTETVLTVIIAAVLIVCLAIIYFCYDKQRRRKHETAKRKLIHVIIATAQANAVN